MLSLNRLATRQLTVRWGRTLLMGCSIALGTASIFGLLILGNSGSVAMERQSRADFGLADVRA